MKYVFKREPVELIIGSKEEAARLISSIKKETEQMIKEIQKVKADFEEEEGKRKLRFTRVGNEIFVNVNDIEDYFSNLARKRRVRPERGAVG